MNSLSSRICYACFSIYTTEVQYTLDFSETFTLKKPLQKNKKIKKNLKKKPLHSLASFSLNSQQIWRRTPEPQFLLQNEKADQMIPVLKLLGAVIIGT